MGLARDTSFKFLPHQLSMVVYWTTMALTGNGGLGFDSGEGAYLFLGLESGHESAPLVLGKARHCQIAGRP